LVTRSLRARLISVWRENQKLGSGSEEPSSDEKPNESYTGNHGEQSGHYHAAVIVCTT